MPSSKGDQHRFCGSRLTTAGWKPQAVTARRECGQAQGNTPASTSSRFASDVIRPCPVAARPLWGMWQFRPAGKLAVLLREGEGREVRAPDVLTATPASHSRFR